MNQSYLPAQSAALVNWLNNYKTKIVVYGPTLGYDNDKVIEIVKWCDNSIAAIQDVEIKKHELKSAVDAKKTSDKTNLAALKSEISRQKVNANYTPAMGQELGVIGSNTGFDAAHYKALITVDITGGHVEVKFKKLGADGINLYHRKKGSPNWNFLARATKSPFIDVIVLATPNQPEHWEYRAFGVIYDEEIGQPSDIVEVIFGG